MDTYAKPEVADLGDLMSLTASSLVGQYYDCNAMPGANVIDMDKGSSQNPSC